MSLLQSRVLTLFSPAKANLFFRVLFKRLDGYHEIASLFQTLNFGDTLTFSLLPKNTNNRDEFTVEGIKVPLDFSENLIGKALELFRKKTKKEFFVKIHLVKNIPLKSGLGGGSSNAATTLFGLNCLLGKPLDQDELLKLAEKIGSDVPFFFSSGSAYCEGRGEKFQDVKVQKKAFYLAFPSFGLSTKEVFAALQLKEKKTPDIQSALLAWQSKTQIKKESRREIIFNALEAAAFKTQPKLKAFKKQLLDLGFEQVSMTGSGSTFICFGKPKRQLLDEADSKISFRLVEMLQRNSASWYPVCLWKKKSLLSPAQPVLLDRL